MLSDKQRIRMVKKATQRAFRSTSFPKTFMTHNGVEVTKADAPCKFVCDYDRWAYTVTIDELWL